MPEMWKSVQLKRTKKIHPFENNQRNTDAVWNNIENHILWRGAISQAFFIMCGFRSFLRIDIVCTVLCIDAHIRYRSANSLFLFDPAVDKS